MNRPFTLYALACLCVSLTGCPESDDGSDGQQACLAYVSAANACLERAGMDSELLDSANCDNITVGYGVTEAGVSSCGFNDLVDVYLCYAEAYQGGLEDGQCDASTTVGSIDLSKCDYTCDPACSVGQRRCSGSRPQVCDPTTMSFVNDAACPDGTTCEGGYCVAEPTGSVTTTDDASTPEDSTVSTEEDAGPTEGEDDTTSAEDDAGPTEDDAASADDEGTSADAGGDNSGVDTDESADSDSDAMEGETTDASDEDSD